MVSEGLLIVSYLHVSAHEFQPGDQVTPGASRGVSNFGHRSNITNDAVHMVGSHKDAVFWVDQLSHARPDVKRWHIYEVQPHGDVQTRPLEGGTWGEHVEHRASRATVKRLRQSRNSTFDASSRSSQHRAGSIIR